MNDLLDSMPVEWLGSAAGALTTLAFVPQIVHTWRRRSADDISGLTFGVFALGVSLWLMYGLVLGLWPIVAANSVTLALASSILWAKFRFRGTATPPSPRE